MDNTPQPNSDSSSTAPVPLATPAAASASPIAGGSRQRFLKPYMWAVILCGAPLLLLTVAHLPFAQLNIRLLLLALMTLFIASRISIKLPGFDSHITVSDTFIFLTALLHGAEAAVLLAAAESAYSSARFCKKRLTIFFNIAITIVSTYFSTSVVRAACGPLRDLPQSDLTALAIIAVCLLGFVQYAVTSTLVSVYGALRSDQPWWATWRGQYLWTSVTFFIGASAAMMIAKVIVGVGLFGVLATTPIIFIIYVTYQTYLKNVETAAANAEQARAHVAELSRYIEEQERIREQYAQVEKLSALGELSSGVAHDFNNTLAGILGRAELMLRRTDDADMKRGLRIIIKSAQDGAKTVKRIQDFARQRRDVELTTVLIGELLEDVCEITRPRWKTGSEAKDIYIDFNIAVTNPHLAILGDASELRDVLVNMVFNAVDAMPEGGRIELAALQRDASVEITVRDTGQGMTPEVRSRIFDPFYTTKGQAGMGLGLAVSYGIIRRHEGEIEVESEPGAGTTMCIRLPVAKSEPIAAAPSDAPAPMPEEMTTSAPLAALTDIAHTNVAFPIAALSDAPPADAAAVSAAVVNVGASLIGNAGLMLVKESTASQILVVDDEEKVRELLRDMLEEEGYRITLASSGAEALELFAARQFDLVFTDIGMPGMSGWEFVRHLREGGTEVPIAVVTGWGETVSSTDKHTAGVQWVLAKPFTFTDIIGIAEEALAKGAPTENTAEHVAVA